MWFSWFNQFLCLGEPHVSLLLLPIAWGHRDFLSMLYRTSAEGLYRTPDVI